MVHTRATSGNNLKFLYKCDLYFLAHDELIEFANGMVADTVGSCRSWRHAHISLQEIHPKVAETLKLCHHALPISRVSYSFRKYFSPITDAGFRLTEE